MCGVPVPFILSPYAWGARQVKYVKRRKSYRMSCGVGEAAEELENDL